MMSRINTTAPVCGSKLLTNRSAAGPLSFGRVTDLVADGRDVGVDGVVVVGAALATTAGPPVLRAGAKGRLGAALDDAPPGCGTGVVTGGGAGFVGVDAGAGADDDGLITDQVGDVERHDVHLDRQAQQVEAQAEARTGRR